MKSMTVRLDDELYKEVKIKMAHEGTKFQEYVLRLIKQDLNKSKDKAN